MIENIDIIHKMHYDICIGKSENGTGGMNTKVSAAEIVYAFGKETIFGNIKYNLLDIIQGVKKRTYFAPNLYIS